MSVRYQETFGPRFTTEFIDGRAQITIPARRIYIVMAFLIFWLGAWTVGGFSAISSLFLKFQPFVFFWLGGWAVGEILVATILCWMISGAETLRVVGSDLEIGHRILGLEKRRRFRGGDIRDLSACAPAPFDRYNRFPLPFLANDRSGSVKFTYGARTIYAGAGLDEPEGRLIVETLRRYLPATVAA